MNRIICIFFIAALAGCTTQTRCGIQECHGLDLTCGTNVPEACTTIYQLGDFCRSYASCASDCTLAPSPAFDLCKGCVGQCETQYDGMLAFDCENTCRARMDKYCTRDSDCACGTRIDTGECYYGKKELVNTSVQCPDYCTGISGKLAISCVNFECTQV